MHRHVHLEQLAVRALVPVLRRRQVADAGRRALAAQRRDLVVAEPIARADQTVLVRVGDAAVRSPQLDAHDGAPQHALMHEPVERRELHAIAADDTVVEVRLDDAPPQHLRQTARLAHRLGFARVAEHDRGRERNDEHRDEARERELQEQPPSRRYGVAGLCHVGDTRELAQTVRARASVRARGASAHGPAAGSAVAARPQAGSAPSRARPERGRADGGGARCAAARRRGACTSRPAS